MGTFTAQILVGQSHTYDGGILNISHMLFLSENDTPAWVLSPVDVLEMKAKDKHEPSRVWIPTLEKMLEDALLMYGIYVMKDEKLVQMAKDYFKPGDNTRKELYRDIESENLERMYERARELESQNKLVISAFQGSSIFSQLEVLEKYQMEVEVTESSFVREYNACNGKVESRGRLGIDT